MKKKTQAKPKKGNSRSVFDWAWKLIGAMFGFLGTFIAILTYFPRISVVLGPELTWVIR